MEKTQNLLSPQQSPIAEALRNAIQTPPPPGGYKPLPPSKKRARPVTNSTGSQEAKEFFVF
jgi:hypothetical protein